MITEHLRVREFRHVSGKLHGKFVLSHVADPDTVKVEVLGRSWYPCDFSQFGDPIIDEEQYFEFLRLEKEQYSKCVSFRQRKPLTAMVSYEPLLVTAPLASFDTIAGIRESLATMYSFYEMLSNRRCYFRETGRTLNEYVVFGRYLLDSYASIYQIQQKVMVPPEFRVCKRERFSKIYGGYIAISSFAFPRKPNDLCPLCGRPFLISDFVRNEGFQYGNGCGPATHRHCP